MNGCDEVLACVDDHVAGTLDRAAAAAVEAHLATCAQCRTIVEDARFLQRLVAELPRTIEPPRDLWPEVRAAIAPARLVRRWTRALAAAALLAVGVGVGFAVRPVPTPTSVPIDVTRFEVQVGEASAELEAAVRAREHELDAETVATVARNLAIIDAAIAETREALDRSPDDPRIADALVSAHHQKIRLLRQVLWAPGTNE